MADATATHATTGATPPGGAFPPFQTNTFVPQLIWFAIAFGLLYYLMSKVALPRVGAVLHERNERIARDLGDAQALRTQSEEAGAAYEASLTLARDKAKGIAQQTRDALAAETDEKRKALEAGLADRLASSEAAIRSKTAEAMSNVRGIAAETASAIVERLTGRAPDGAAINAALDRTIKA